MVVAARRAVIWLALCACSAPASRGSVAPAPVPWCAWALMIRDGGAREHVKVCSETEDVCTWAVGRGRTYGRMANIITVDDCHRQ